MSLDFNLTEIKDYKNRCWVPVNPDEPDGKKNIYYVTEGLIWAGLRVDLSGITEKNIDKWAERLDILQQIGMGDFLYDTKDDEVRYRNFTYQELLDHVGLRTNVSTKTDAQWRKKIWDELEYRAKRNVKLEKEDLEKKAG